METTMKIFSLIYPFEGRDWHLSETSSSEPHYVGSFLNCGPCCHLKDLVKTEHLVPLNDLSVGNSFLPVLDNLGHIYMGHISKAWTAADLSLGRTPCDPPRTWEQEGLVRSCYKAICHSVPSLPRRLSWDSFSLLPGLWLRLSASPPYSTTADYKKA